MGSSEAAPNRRQLGTSLFGYRRRHVEAHLAEAEHRLKEVEAENERLRDQQGAADDLGHHMAGLLRRFADSISAGESEAAAQAAQIITGAEVRANDIEAAARRLLADARDLAAATYAEAGRRYEEVIATRQSASRRIEDAIEKMADGLATLEALPPFPDLPLPVPAMDATSRWDVHSGQGEREGPGLPSWNASDDPAPDTWVAVSTGGDIAHQDDFGSRTSNGTRGTGSG